MPGLRAVLRLDVLHGLADLRVRDADFETLGFLQFQAFVDQPLQNLWHQPALHFRCGFHVRRGQKEPNPRLNVVKGVITSSLTIAAMAMPRFASLAPAPASPDVALWAWAPTWLPTWPRKKTVKAASPQPRAIRRTDRRDGNVNF